MSDLFNRNVINIFNRDRSHGKDPIIQSPDGFEYVETTESIHDRSLNFKEIVDKYAMHTYIVKVLEPHKDSPIVKNFLVSGERLAEFLRIHTDHNYPGKIVDIEKYFPSELA